MIEQLEFLDKLAAFFIFSLHFRKIKSTIHWMLYKDLGLIINNVNVNSH